MVSMPHRRWTLITALISALFALTAPPTAPIAAAQDNRRTVPDYGRAEYVANCASCHGPEGRRDGHFRDFLIQPPSDLTRLSRDNQGVFPVQRALAIIDGRAEVAAHGSREMPIMRGDNPPQAAPVVGHPPPVEPVAYTTYRLHRPRGSCNLTY